MKKISLIVLTMTVFIIACNNQSVDQQVGAKAPITIDGKWGLITMNGKDLSLDRKEILPEIAVNTKEKQLKGFSGCNRITMTFEIMSENKIEFKPGIMTRMACPDANYEAAFMDALLHTKAYKLNDSILVFYNHNSVEIMKFQHLQQ